jgi:hypothetical protein
MISVGTIVRVPCIGKLPMVISFWVFCLPIHLMTRNSQDVIVTVANEANKVYFTEVFR